MSPVATSGESTSHPATVGLVVVIVLLFIGLLAISIFFIVRRRNRSRQSDGIRPLRMGRPQLLTGGSDKFVVVYDDEKEKMSLPLKTSGGGDEEVASIASLPYSSSYGADTFYPAPPPKAVVTAHKKKHILSNLSPFKAAGTNAPRVVISSPKRIQPPQVSVSVTSDKAGETWSQIDLQTPGGLRSTSASNTLSTIPEEGRAPRYPGSAKTRVLAVPPPSYLHTSSGGNNGQLPPVITLSPATPPVTSALAEVAGGLEELRH